MPAKPTTDKYTSKWPYAVLAIAALVAGWFLANKQQPSAVAPPPLEVATLLMPPKIVKAEGLLDHEGRPFTIQQLQGHYSFIFFGYTNCPDVCPATLYQFKQVAKILQSDPQLYAKTRFILVSVDPQRDTPEQLKTYVKYYHPDFIGVSGSPEKIKQFSRQMGVIYERREAENADQDNYLVDHSSAILMTNTQGQLQVIYSAPHQADSLSKDYRAIYQYLENRS